MDMEMDPMNDRVKRLFADLERSVEPAEGQVIPVHFEHIDIENEDRRRRGGARTVGTQPLDLVCPFLRTAWDATVRYGWAHKEHACYRAQQAQPVSTADQAKTCFGKRHSQCPIYQGKNGEVHEDNRFTPFLRLIKRCFGQ